MSSVTTSKSLAFETFRSACVALGLRLRDVARLCGIHEVRLSRITRELPPSTAGATRQLTAVARALMAEALKRGWSDDAVWELNEQQLFGLPGELDRERVMAEVKAKAREVRSA